MALARPVATNDNVPLERVEALRRAFDATMKDADFLAEAQRLQLEIDPLGGEAIARLLAGAYAAPREIVDRAAALVEPGARKTP
jgi:tripartite-type tricarboxylate transporter receptor subunit TctC